MIKKNIVFLPIGENQCGDAIAIRLWDTDNPNDKLVILIDGGYKDDWKKIQDLVFNNFKAERINLVISTHLDGDHIAGLIGVVQNIPVDKLWMHLPWEHFADLLDSRQQEFVSMNATDWLKKSLGNSSDLALAAEAAGVDIQEPFTGKQFVTKMATLTVLGPTLPYYESLLPQVLDKSAFKVATQNSSPYYSLAEELRKVIASVKGLAESHFIETLSDEGDTAPSNNSSTVVLLEVAGETAGSLFTGDAGKQALANAYTEYISRGHIPGELSFVQVPHHGSRRNVGPTVLNGFLGGRTASKDDRRGTAFVSTVEKCESHGHPKRVTTNAFKRRGYPVFKSGNIGVKHGHELEGYSSPAEPLPLFAEVEAE